MSERPQTSAGAVGDNNQALSDKGGAVWKKWVYLVGWLIGAPALYFFLTYYFDWPTFSAQLATVSWPLLAMASSAFFVGLLMRAVRWTYVVRSHQPLPWNQGYHVIMISNMANFFFPVRLGEILKLVLIKKTCGVAYSSSTAASIIEKLTFFLIIIVFLGLVPFAGYWFPGWTSRFVPIVLALITIVIVFLFLGETGVERIKAILERLMLAWGVRESRVQFVLNNQLVLYVANTVRQCHFSAYPGKRFFWIAASGFVVIGLDGLSNFFLLQAFGLDLTYPQAVIAACFFSMLFLLPSPPAQVGTAEIYPVLIYAGGLKLAAPVVASAALVWHMATMAILAVLGTVSLYAMGLRLGSLIRMTREQKNLSGATG